jgi:hypothetical protein
VGLVLCSLDRVFNPFLRYGFMFAVLRRVLNTWKRKKEVVPPFIFVYFFKLFNELVQNLVLGSPLKSCFA